MIERGIGMFQIEGDRKYPSDEFYLREAMYPFSCMHELDVRPIEQRLPDNDTREARRAARLAKQKESMNQNANVNAAAYQQPIDDNGHNNLNDDKPPEYLHETNKNKARNRRKPTNRQDRLSIIRCVFGILFVVVIACIVGIYVFAYRERKDKPF